MRTFCRTLTIQGFLLCLSGTVALRLDACTSGRFGSTPYLKGVQTLRTNTTPLSYHGFKHQDSGGLQGLFVYPKTKLAMCTIEKNGCSAWLTIFGKMMHNDLSISSPDYFEVISAWSEDAASKVFHDPRSVRVLWIRDPLERFLSGFLNKCMNNDSHDYPGHCPFARTAQPPGFPLSQAQSWLRAGGVLYNGHYALQSLHCELRKRLHKYNVIGLMTHSDFAKNAECILEQAGLSYLNKRADGKPFFRHPMNAGRHETAGRELLKKFFTKDFAYELLELYKDDYDLFRLERPTWVHEATGEWFNSSAGDAAHPKQASPDEDWEVEDDLISAAERAGFYLAGRERHGHMSSS